MAKRVSIDTELLGVNWQPNTQYRIAVEPDFVRQEGGNQLPNPEITNLRTFTTNSTGPEALVDVPNGNNVINNTFISIQFNRNIKAGNGNFYLYERVGGVDTLIATFNPSDSTGSVTMDGDTITMNTLGLIRAGTNYYLLFEEGAVTDRDGFDAPGWPTDDTQFNFTTAPSTGDFPDLSANLVNAFTPTIGVGVIEQFAFLATAPASLTCTARLIANPSVNLDAFLNAITTANFDWSPSRSLLMSANVVTNNQKLVGITASNTAQASTDFTVGFFRDGSPWFDAVDPDNAQDQNYITAAEYANVQNRHFGPGRLVDRIVDGLEVQTRLENGADEIRYEDSNGNLLTFNQPDTVNYTSASAPVFGRFMNYDQEQDVLAISNYMRGYLYDWSGDTSKTLSQTIYGIYDQADIPIPQFTNLDSDWMGSVKISAKRNFAIVAHFDNVIQYSSQDYTTPIGFLQPLSFDTTFGPIRFQNYVSAEMINDDYVMVNYTRRGTINGIDHDLIKTDIFKKNSNKIYSLNYQPQTVTHGATYWYSLSTDPDLTHKEDFTVEFNANFGQYYTSGLGFQIRQDQVIYSSMVHYVEEGYVDSNYFENETNQSDYHTIERSYSDNKIRYKINGVTQITSSSAIVNGNEYHIAVSRKAGYIKLFINGSQSGSTQFNDTVINSNGFAVCTTPSGYADGSFFGNLRISNQSLYNGNFTAPARTELLDLDNRTIVYDHTLGFADSSNRYTTAQQQKAKIYTDNFTLVQNLIDKVHSRITYNFDSQKRYLITSSNIGRVLRQPAIEYYYTTGAPNYDAIYTDVVPETIFVNDALSTHITEGMSRINAEANINCTATVI